jgi:3-oxoacyl-(acyl-carrier-protein) synthase
MNIYINGTGCVSPQRSWDAGSFLETVAEHSGRMIQCLEPDVDPGLDDKYLRRMSRLIRLGWIAAKCCTDDAGQRPDAIITGSGWGSVLDSEKFLLSIYKNKENFLPPTPFIQSTHNALGAQIAMLLNSCDYNMSYAHGNFSFEQALIDGMMHLQAGDSRWVLAGGFDEITANQFTLMDRLGTWRNESASNLRLFDQEEKGTIAGEGFGFFMLGIEPGKNVYARVEAVETIFARTLTVADSQSLNKLNTDHIDLVLAGLNGDRETDLIYRGMLSGLFPQGVNIAAYKHLCGEYHTSSAFAMWLAARLLKDQSVPAAIKFVRGNPPKEINRIMIYTHHKGERHSFIVLSRPD